MLYDLWDYGSLDYESEKKYIRAIIKQLNLKQEYLKCFVESVMECQKVIKTEVKKQQSSVSLRDIKRVVRIFKFYYDYIEFRELFRGGKCEEEEEGQEDMHNDKDDYEKFDEFCEARGGISYEGMQERHFIKAFVITILINYIFRIADRGKS